MSTVAATKSTEDGKKRFTLKREIDFGDLLTPLSILIALITVVLTWQSDRDARLKQYADGIRHSSSVVSAKLERWSTLADRYFDDIQHTLTEVSGETAADHKYQPARRKLFEGLRDAEGKASQRIVDEQLETSYMELYGYVPSLRPSFNEIKCKISKEEHESHTRLELALQDVLQRKKLLASSDSSDMGNELRRVAAQERNQLRANIRNITDPLVENILRLINLSDSDLADPKMREAQIQIFKSAEKANDCN